MLLKGIKFLNSCGVPNHDILICGSIALKYQGITLGRDIHDVDVCVVRSDRYYALFKAMCDAQGNTYYQSKENSYQIDGCKNKPFIIYIGDGVYINIWLIDRISSCLTVDEGPFSEITGCYVQPVNKIINAKKSYNRTKDWADIGYIAGTLLSPTFKPALPAVENAPTIVTPTPNK